MAKKSKLRKIAIVTYNRIGSGQYENGVITGKNVQVFIAQNGHRSKWAVHPDSDNEQGAETRARMSRNVLRQVELADMDRVYVYVGSNGGEEMILQTRDLPAEKVTYVMCDCSWGHKKGLIKKFGHEESGIIECECGGQITLEDLLKDLLNE
jgi:hypothetical protein